MGLKCHLCIRDSILTYVYQQAYHRINKNQKWQTKEALQQQSISCILIYQYRPSKLYIILSPPPLILFHFSTPPELFFKCNIDLIRTYVSLPTYLPSPCCTRRHIGQRLASSTVPNLKPSFPVCSISSQPISFLFPRHRPQVIFGRPSFLLPSGVHLRDILVILSVTLHVRTCPFQRKLNLLMMVRMSEKFPFLCRFCQRVC